MAANFDARNTGRFKQAMIFERAKSLDKPSACKSMGDFRGMGLGNIFRGAGSRVLVVGDEEVMSLASLYTDKLLRVGRK